MMKSLLWSGLSLLFLFISSVFANVPLSSVQVSLRGKKYQVEDVTTVNELQERLAEQSGVDMMDQGRVLFNGKRLDASESLSTAGVGPGDQLNVVPMSSKAKSSSSKSSKSSSSSSAASASSAPAAASDPAAKMKEMLAASGIDTNELEEMAKSMGGGADGKAPSMAESMEMMTDMMNSPIFSEYMNDPEKLEQSRQMILNNPMMKSMMAGMPGMEEILNDPDAWREAMQAAASMYQNMDKDDLMNAMMGGAGMGGMGGGGAGGGMPPGLFDGMDMSTTALDELSEGED